MDKGKEEWGEGKWARGRRVDKGKEEWVRGRRGG